MVLNPHHDSLDTSCLSHNDIIPLERQTTCVLEFTDCVRRLERMRQVKMNDYTLQNIEFRIVVGHVGYGIQWMYGGVDNTSVYDTFINTPLHFQN